MASKRKGAALRRHCFSDKVITIPANPFSCWALATELLNDDRSGSCEIAPAYHSSPIQNSLGVPLGKVKSMRLAKRRTALRTVDSGSLFRSAWKCGQLKTISGTVSTPNLQAVQIAWSSVGPVHDGTHS